MKNKYTALIMGLVVFFLSTIESQAQSKYSSFNYNISIPMGDLTNYNNSTSFRGFSLEFGEFLTDNISVGIAGSWNVFNDVVANTPYVNDNVTLTGKQYRYTNAYPIYVNGNYIMGGKASKVKPYVGLGLGTIINERKTEIGVYVVKNTSWHFAVVPQGGIMIDINGYMNMNLGATYEYGLKTGSADAIQYLRTNIGLTYQFF